MVYIFLADGFEESEALLPADILKRAGLDVCLVSIGAAGVLKDKRATCYPGFEKYLDCKVYTERLVEEDDHIITGRGPGAAAEFGFTIAERLTSAECVAQLRQGMIYAPTTYRP